MAPTAFDIPAPHHGLTTSAALILIAGAAALIAPMLMRSHREPEAMPQAVHQSAERAVTPIFEQFVQLDEVVIRSSAEAAPARSAFDSASALSAIRAVGDGLRECGAGSGDSVGVAVTFAPAGGAVSAAVEDGLPLGSVEESCILRRLLGARAPAYDGGPETVRTVLVSGR